MQFFFLSRSVRMTSEWNVWKWFKYGLWFALCLHINIVHSRRKERQYSWLAHINPIKKKYLEGIFVDCKIIVIHWGEMINKLTTFLGLFARRESVTYSKGYWASDIEIKDSLHVIIGLSFRFCKENIF